MKPRLVALVTCCLTLSCAIALKARLRMVPVHAFVLNYHCPQCPTLAERTGGTYTLIPPQKPAPAAGR